MLIASWTGFDEFLDVLLQGGPPETLEKGMPCPLNTRVAGELGGVGHSSTSVLKAGGTKRQLDGQELGPGCPSVAALTLSSMSQVNLASVRLGFKGKTMEGKGGPKRSTHGRQR